MRLLRLDNLGEILLTKDLCDNIPPYAILSHTWGADNEEVIFSDFNNNIQNNDHGASNAAKKKVGYSKLRFCGQQARKDGLDYFWVDTCCINKSDMSELQAAINSMFRWYRDSAKCYVYLTDVSSRKRDHEGEVRSVWEPTLRRSRWFTRGWTLQELLAPRSLQFFSRDGDQLGDRDSLGLLIQQITGIPTTALQASDLSHFPIEVRMRWVRSRKTTKPEDIIYCLLGIFGVSMFLLYGEGEERALNRLKDEINKQQRSCLDEIRLSPPRQISSDLAPYRRQGSDDVQADALRERRSLLMDSLSFEQMDSRQATIKAAHVKTCAWLLENSQYLDWNDPAELDRHHGFMWIKGKPGAGKSTLMKFAHASARKKRLENEILLAFFFNARGGSLEKSTVGMFRSLLFHLLGKATNLQDVFDEIEIPSNLDNDSSLWSIELLHELFTAAVSKLTNKQRLRCFIDALDECDERDVQNMIVYFENLSEISDDRLQICFASRHYPTIVVRNGLELVLEHEPGHSEDVLRYVRNNLRIKNEDETLRQEIEQRVQEKANGVFMWVVLVVDILNEEVRRGGIYNVSRRLEALPASLGDLFKDILRRDRTDMDKLLLCLQWILFAKRPLTPREFYHAMIIGLVETVDDGHLRRVSDNNIINFVNHSSKGLAELTLPTKRRKRGENDMSTPTVQFIHESVRDFLLKDGGLHELWPDLAADHKSLAHEKLKLCCQRYLEIDLGASFLCDGSLPRVGTPERIALKRDVDERFPFLEYATGQVFYHANEAAVHNPQASFLDTIESSNWVHKYDLAHERRYRASTTSLLYLLTESNSGRLIRAMPDCDVEKWESGSIRRRRYPFFAALESIKLKRRVHREKDDTPMYWALRIRRGPEHRVGIVRNGAAHYFGLESSSRTFCNIRAADQPSCHITSLPALRDGSIEL